MIKWSKWFIDPSRKIIADFQNIIKKGPIERFLNMSEVKYSEKKEKP